MHIEIERKFLVIDDSWRRHRGRRIELRQGYLCTGGKCTVRVRTDGEHGWLTVKGRTENISRPEFEYLIPREDAEAMLVNLSSGGIVEKVRYFVNVDGTEWVVDEFSGRNRGLVLAELELSAEDVFFEKPAWAGEEVSGDYRYHNSSLANNPYRDWPKK
ncbi:MAG: CYTH domain-containing protein [Victivallales bacterium]|nr:CYTH domain-containing protein [Victivallales bacterium]